MHQAASSPIGSQIRFCSGASQSLLKRTIVGGVDQLGARRVEPGGQPQRVGVVEVDRRVFLGDERREGHVVPGGVAAEHAEVEARLGREGPLGDGQGGDAEGDQQGDVLHPRRRHFAPRRRRLSSARARRRRGRRAMQKTTIQPK